MILVKPRMRQPGRTAPAPRTAANRMAGCIQDLSGPVKKFRCLGRQPLSGAVEAGQ